MQNLHHNTWAKLMIASTSCLFVSTVNGTCLKNKENRDKNNTIHTSGSKSFQQRSAEEVHRIISLRILQIWPFTMNIMARTKLLWVMVQERNGDARVQDSEPPTPHSVVKIGLRGASLYFSMKRLFINITMDIVTTFCGLSFIILYWVIVVSFSPSRTLIFVYGQCDIELIRLEL